MSRQDKATTERHTRQLRELVKRPENKVCADCKRNDPRWASWNIGVFLCIRCSGIHRGMGTHISKVKSIDLDTWTPEQMESIMKWGNKRANLYWEAHLKQGHVPPDHKMESFIRSKYESRRWAMEGPPPRDPSVLEGGAAEEPLPEASPIQPVPSQQQQQRVPAPSRATAAPSVVSPVTSRQPQGHQLLSAQHIHAQSTARASPAAPTAQNSRPAPSAPAPAPAPPKPSDDLFSLDFHAPAAPSSPPAAQDAPKKDVKQDILSLFSTSAAAPQQSSPWAAAAPPFSNAPAQGAAPSLGFNAWTGAAPAQGNVWGQPAAAAAQPTSNGWSQPTNVWGQPQAAPAHVQGWGQPVQPPQQQASLFNATDAWAGSGSGAGPGVMSSGADIWGSAQPAPAQQKKDDAFGDLWGGFK